MSIRRRGLWIIGLCFGTILSAQPIGPTDALLKFGGLQSSTVYNAVYWLRPDGTYVELFTHGKTSALPASYHSGQIGTYTLSANATSPGTRDLVMIPAAGSSSGPLALKLDFDTGRTNFPSNLSSFAWMARNNSPIANTSARGYVDAGHGTVAGFVLSSRRWVLIRGVGPSLATFHIPDAIRRTKVRVYSGSTLLNDSDQFATADFYSRQFDPPAPWYSYAAFASGLDATFAMVGAFPFQAGEGDCATLMLLEPGVYTVDITTENNSDSGSVLAEVYVLPYGAQ